MREAHSTIFTDQFLRSLKPAPRPYKRAELAPKGEGRLTVRVLPSGSKEFFYRYRVNGNDRMLALGRFDPQGKTGVTLAQVRETLKATRALQRATGDVKAHQRTEERRAEIEARKGTLRQLLAAYVQSLRDANKPSAYAAEHIFERHVTKAFPRFVDLKANEVLPEHIGEILAKMVKAGITRQVNKTRAYLRAAFAYGAKADHDPRTLARDGALFALRSNPVSLTPVIREYERARERTLSEDELRAFWKALDSLPVIQGATLRLPAANAIAARRLDRLRLGRENPAPQGFQGARRLARSSAAPDRFRLGAAQGAARSKRSSALAFHVRWEAPIGGRYAVLCRSEHIANPAAAARDSTVSASGLAAHRRDHVAEASR
jgi:hypothetical protein